MNTEHILKVLKNERECIKRQAGTTKDGYYVSLCDRNCDKCDLCLPDDEILEVYDFLINSYEMLQNESAKSYTIRCKEPLTDFELDYLKDQLSCAETFTASFEPMAFPEGLVAVMTDEWGREHFNGICPYTNKKCEKWTCGVCEVEKRERRLMEGDTDNGNE